ncbi:MAG: hypothetical protein A2V66_01785 [Ignavibacteria bacterium RBG_13_36_8]|nr:MAG: hypothetical protein A2V66_01785 [Ignavibacteria bacterium RBG_13_36_8]
MDKKQIFEKFRDTVNPLGFILIDISYRGDDKNRIIEVFIDNDKGITSQDCATVSMRLSTLLQEENLVESNYRLDVSSPGVDRPLKYLQQFPKHVNRKFEVRYLEGEEIIKFSGKLVNVEGDYLTFTDGKNERRINFNNIQKANVLISF